MPNLITSDVATEVRLVATSGQTVFSFSFVIFEIGDLVVTVNGVVTTPISVSGIGSSSGGSIQLSARTAGDVVEISRALPIRRSIDLPTTGPYSSDDIDTEFDRTFAILQQQETRLDRAVQVPVGTEAVLLSDDWIDALAGNPDDLGAIGPAGTLSASGLTFVTPDQFGAAGDGVTDDYAAFVAALAYLKTLGNNVSGYIGTPTLYCPNAYYLSQTLDIKQTLRIQGQGNGQQSGASRSTLKWPASTAGIRIHRSNTMGNGVEAHGDRADGTILDGLYLIGGGGAANELHSGVWMRARATVQNCNVTGFAGNGIMVKATQSGSAVLADWDPLGEGNANCWFVSNCSLTNNQLSGLYCNGADANAGTSIMVDSSYNKQCGIYDSSFLGNTHINRHCEGNVVASIKTDDPNAPCLFIGGYDETGWPGANVVPPSMILGGFQGGTNNQGGGLRLSNSLSYMILFNRGLAVQGPVISVPGSGITLEANGELVVEATNNTTATIKLKGSDGVVRSGTIALS